MQTLLALDSLLRKSAVVRHSGDESAVENIDRVEVQLDYQVGLRRWSFRRPLAVCPFLPLGGSSGSEEVLNDMMIEPYCMYIHQGTCVVLDQW